MLNVKNRLYPVARRVVCNHLQGLSIKIKLFSSLACQSNSTTVYTRYLAVPLGVHGRTGRRIRDPAFGHSPAHRSPGCRCCIMLIWLAPRARTRVPRTARTRVHSGIDVDKNDDIDIDKY
jgi:hypothetical protein